MHMSCRFRWTRELYAEQDRRHVIPTGSIKTTCAPFGAGAQIQGRRRRLWGKWGSAQACRGRSLVEWQLHHLWHSVLNKYCLPNKVKSFALLLVTTKLYYAATNVISKDNQQFWRYLTATMSHNQYWTIITTHIPMDDDIFYQSSMQLLISEAITVILSFGRLS